MRVASKSHMLDKPINDQHLHEKNGLVLYGHQK